MTLLYRFIACVIAFAPVTVLAGQSAPAAGPTPPDAAIPAFQYESAFASYRPATDEDKTPDTYWLTANKDVAGGGHSMHNMQSSSTESDKPMQMNMQGDHSGHDMGGH